MKNQQIERTFPWIVVDGSRRILHHSSSPDGWLWMSPPPPIIQTGRIDMVGDWSLSISKLPESLDEFFVLHFGKICYDSYNSKRGGTNLKPRDNGPGNPRVQGNRTVTRLTLLGILTLFMLPFVSGCVQNKTLITTPPMDLNAPQDAQDQHEGDRGLVQKVLADAFTQLGKPYRMGGHSPQTGFDCSGFTSWVYGLHGIKLPRASGDQRTVGRPVAREDIQPGDIVVYHERRWFHAGLYIGNGEFIHSPHTGDVIKVSPAFDKYRSPRLVAIRRVHDDPNPQPLPADLRASLSAEALSRNRGFRAESVRTAKADKDKLKNRSRTAGKSRDAKETASAARSRARAETAKASAAAKKNPADKGKPSARLTTENKKAPKAGTPALGKDSATKKTPPAKPAEKAVAKAGKAGKNQTHYQVREGDTLYTVSRRFKVSQDNLAKANRIKGGKSLQIGQTLKIPES
jgi:LysM repeat protein